MRRLTGSDIEDDLRADDQQGHATRFAQSYLVMRRTVGVAGALLPTVLILTDLALLEADLSVRDSLSSYYHSGARDFFVATLCVVGVALLTYRAARPMTWPFVLSAVAGLAAFVVAFVPTELPEGRPGSVTTPVQDRLGEQTSDVIHLTAAAIFIVSLGLLCFLTADTQRRGLAAGTVSRAGSRTGARARIWLHRACGTTIFLAFGFIVVGSLAEIEVGALTPLYLGEVVAVYAFSLSWLAQARSLARLLRAS